MVLIWRRFWKPRGPTCCTRRRWVDNIITYGQTLVWEVLDWIYLVRESRWRNFVRAVTKFSFL